MRRKKYTFIIKRFDDDHNDIAESKLMLDIARLMFITDDKRALAQVYQLHNDQIEVELYSEGNDFPMMLADRYPCISAQINYDVGS